MMAADDGGGRTQSLDQPQPLDWRRLMMVA
jgi:hypothetical protein